MESGYRFGGAGASLTPYLGADYARLDSDSFSEDGGFGFEDLDAASDNPDDRKYRQVCQLVFESQKASASWLQRQMGVGYNTASKWIERMERDGFVGPANHVGRREIYRDIAKRYVPDIAADGYVDGTDDQPRALCAVSLSAPTTKIVTWRMPVAGEDPRGVWAKRYFLPGTKWSDRS